MDFVLDRTAQGCVIKTLTNDDTRAAVIEVEQAVSGFGVARALGWRVLTRRLPQVIRSDNDKKFCGKSMVAWAYE